MFSRNKFFGKDGYPDQSITEIGIYTSWRSINYTSRYKVELKFDNGESFHATVPPQNFSPYACPDHDIYPSVHINNGY